VIKIPLATPRHPENQRSSSNETTYNKAKETSSIEIGNILRDSFTF
jgi:hypothetical protein